MARYTRFNVVGVAGFVVQCAVLALLVHGLGMWYTAAGALAVEAAVLHNFVWHERWTWRDRPRADSVWRRLLRFHVANGLSSMAAHAIGLPLLARIGHVPPLVASALLVAALSYLNYRLGDRLVFACRNEVLPPRARIDALSG